MYNADFFINFFSSIPEEKWCTHIQRDSNGKSCAYGHLNRLTQFDGEGKEYQAFTHFDRTIAVRLITWHNSSGIMSSINNGWVDLYNQDTPKQRVLAALRDIKEALEKERLELSTMTVDSLIKENQLVEA